jgi:hypothetical protein
VATQSAKRIALYARVSTSKCEKCGKRHSDREALDHEYRGQDSEVQLRELREYVELRGWQITEIYTDNCQLILIVITAGASRVASLVSSAYMPSPLPRQVQWSLFARPSPSSSVFPV